MDNELEPKEIKLDLVPIASSGGYGDGSDGNWDQEQQFRQHPKEWREEAFELWAFVFGRNANATAREMENRGKKVPTQTILRWARTDNWRDKAADRLRDMAPDVQAGIITDLISAAHESLQASRKVIHSVNTRDLRQKPLTMPESNLLLGVMDRAGIIPRQTGLVKVPRRSGVAKEQKELMSDAEIARQSLERMRSKREGDTDDEGDI